MQLNGNLCESGHQFVDPDPQLVDPDPVLLKGSEWRLLENVVLGFVMT